jgi:DNA-binding NarL/FixJ family response regulator
VLDDHALVGQAIGGLLGEAWRFEALQVASTVPDALCWIKAQAPDLLISDWDLGSGISPEPVIAALMEQNPQARLILLTAHAADLQLPAAWIEITLAVVDKADGWTSLHEALLNWTHAASGSASQLPCFDPRALQALPPRELRLVCELGRGLINKEIAQSLSVSINTVATYRKSISAKLGISGSELVRAAVLARCLNLCTGNSGAGS